MSITKHGSVTVAPNGFTYTGFHHVGPSLNGEFTIEALEWARAEIDREITRTRMSREMPPRLVGEMTIEELIAALDAAKKGGA